MLPQLYFPVKPWAITQAWGILNPSYNQFGFYRHNGIDVREGADRTTYCPVQNLYIYDTGYGSGTGNRVKAYTLDIYTFPDGKKARLEVIVMHGEKHLCKVGDTLQPGDPMMISDHTGFSTGPHVHFMVRRLHPDTYKLIDTNDADNSIDPAPYFTGFYAKDVPTIIGKLQAIISLLTSFLSSKKGV